MARPQHKIHERIGNSKANPTAADFDDTPACALPVLPSKRHAQELLGGVIPFVEPTFFPKSRAARRATLRQVRRSLECVDTFALDKMLEEQKETE